MKIYNQEKRIFEEKRYIEFDTIDINIAFNTMYQNDKLKNCKYIIVNILKHQAFTSSHIVTGESDVVTANGFIIRFSYDANSGSIKVDLFDETVDSSQFSILSIYVFK